MGATEERTVDRRTAARTEPGGAAAVGDQQTQAGPGGPGEQDTEKDTNKDLV